MVARTDQIWEEFSAALRLFILSRVRDEDAAEDILQDAFIKIHGSIDKLKDVRKLRPWLYQITRNTIIDYYRNRRPDVDLSDLPEIAAEEPSKESEAGAPLACCVRALIDRLPAKYRESLVLTEFEGLTQKEMGQKLGLSFSGAKSRSQRAREQLKGELLGCCEFEFDRRGNILEYEPKSPNAPACCRGGLQMQTSETKGSSIMDMRTKELIAIGASITANCQPCLEYHVGLARENGATDEEINEAIEMGKKVRTGSAGKMDKFAENVLVNVPPGPPKKDEECGCDQP